MSKKGEKMHNVSNCITEALLKMECEECGFGSDLIKTSSHPLGIKIAFGTMHAIIVRNSLDESPDLAKTIIKCVTGIATSDEYTLVAHELREGNNMVIDTVEANYFFEKATEQGGIADASTTKCKSDLDYINERKKIMEEMRSRYDCFPF